MCSSVRQYWLFLLRASSDERQQILCDDDRINCKLDGEPMCDVRAATATSESATQAEPRWRGLGWWKHEPHCCGAFCCSDQNILVDADSSFSEFHNETNLVAQRYFIHEYLFLFNSSNY